MRPGKLDRRITIEQVTLAQNAMGEPVETWAPFAEVWTDVRPMTATERFESDARHSARVSNFRIRYLTGIDPTMRISYEGLSWRILGIAELGRREGLDVTAEVVY